MTALIFRISAMALCVILCLERSLAQAASVKKITFLYTFTRPGLDIGKPLNLKTDPYTCSVEGSIRITRSDLYFGMRQFDCSNGRPDNGSLSEGIVYPINATYTGTVHCDPLLFQDEIICGKTERIPAKQHVPVLVEVIREDYKLTTHVTEQSIKIVNNKTTYFKELDVKPFGDGETFTSKLFGLSTPGSVSIDLYEFDITGSFCTITVQTSQIQGSIDFDVQTCSVEY